MFSGQYMKAFENLLQTENMLIVAQMDPRGKVCEGRVLCTHGIPKVICSTVRFDVVVLIKACLYLNIEN